MRHMLSIIVIGTIVSLSVHKVHAFDVQTNDHRYCGSNHDCSSYQRDDTYMKGYGAVRRNRNNTRHIPPVGRAIAPPQVFVQPVVPVVPQVTIPFAQPFGQQPYYPPAAGQRYGYGVPQTRLYRDPPVVPFHPYINSGHLQHQPHRRPHRQGVTLNFGGF